MIVMWEILYFWNYNDKDTSMHNVCNYVNKDFWTSEKNSDKDMFIKYLLCKYFVTGLYWSGDIPCS